MDLPIKWEEEGCHLRDTKEFIKKCTKCQIYAPIRHCPPEKITSITAPWPFAQWGVYLVGPFLPEKGGVKYMIVVIDYFTKWVKVEPLATIMSKSITKFL